MTGERYRIVSQITERIQLCNATYSKVDKYGDFWVVNCDLDMGHEGSHTHKKDTWTELRGHQKPYHQHIKITGCYDPDCDRDDKVPLDYE